MNQTNTSAAPATTMAAQSPGDQIKSFIASGAWYRHLSSLLALAGVITLGTAMLLWAVKPAMVPVSSHLSQQDAVTVTDLLHAENIPFDIQSGTGMILVPADQLDKVRLKLAASGISGNNGTGIEMLEKDQSLGTSRFIENARYHHAQEIELSRTISAMKNIDSARVHLAIPKQSVFIRNRAKPSASVMVKMQPGRSLSDEQVSAIINLVASSVPYMESSEVTIVDQWGRLLSDGGDGDGLSGARKQLEFQQKLETTYSRRIEELLTPILGVGKVRAKVSAEVDFTYSESTREAYDGDPTKIRSEQTEENQTRGANAPIGIPGALSNQPPPAGTTNDKAGDKNAEGPSSVSTQAVKNYELDRTISHSRNNVGQLKRLSVAVLVDNKNVVNEAGETVKEPLSEQELETLTNIVKKAVGYDEQRGDTVAVFNQPFQPVEEMEPVAGPPIWEQPWIWSLARQLLIGVALILLVLFVARPAVRNLRGDSNASLPAPGNESGQETADGELSNDQVSLSASQNGNGLPPQLNAPPHAYGDVLNLARGLANEDPKRVAKLIKDWVASNA